MRVGVVTDSTADIPLGLADELGIRIVPMSVAFGQESFISGVTIDDEDFYRRLGQSGELPTTSQPAPAWFEEAYADCADDGLEAVVSIHVSRELSGTVQVAEQMAAQASIPVHVVDSRQVGGGLALLAFAAERASSAEGGVEEVLAAVEQTRLGLVNTLVVDTLDYLRRGGRVTGAQALVGNMMRVKPLLQVADGRIEPVERSRTLHRGLVRLVERTLETTGTGPLDVVVTHGLTPEHAATVETLIREDADVRRLWTLVFGPVLGTHTGPGSVAVAAVSTTH